MSNKLDRAAHHTGKIVICADTGTACYVEAAMQLRKEISKTQKKCILFI